MLKSIPLPSVWLLEVLVVVGEVIVGFILLIVGGVITVGLTMPLWKKVESFHIPSMKKEFLLQNECYFQIYGPDCKGRYTSIEKLIKEYGVESIVTLHHEVAGKEKENILLDADIFIQTSRFEGMPMGILEAMSYALPVLITEGTTLGEVVDAVDAGWVAETNVQSIVTKIEQTFVDRESWKKKSARARELAETQFEWKQIGKETVNMYQVMCKNR